MEELFRAGRSDVRLVGEIGRYIRDGGGKRIRPALLLLACRLCGYRGERAVLLASVVEFIHTATLLHDDIIDEATVRRGRRSVNSRWGNDITVLVGDFLYTKSMAHGALPGQPADPAPALRRHPAHDRGRDPRDRGQRQPRRHARRTTSTSSGARRPTSSRPAPASPPCSAASGDEQRARPGQLRPEPRDLLPDGGRPARLHRRREDARQAGGQRPARGQADAAHHLPAAAGGGGGARR